MPNNKFVCADCVYDYAIIEFINAHLEATYCDYCDNESEEPIAAPTNLVLEFIEDGIRYEYGNPVDVGVSWDSEDEEYIGASIWETDDLIIHHLAAEYWSDNFAEDIVKHLGETELWAGHELIGPVDAVWKDNWDDFVEFVKHESRYVFLRSTKVSDSDPRDISIAEMLDVLGHMSIELNLLRTLDTGQIVYRVRADESRLFSHAKEIGPPPREFATNANRMNPAGIPMFYGSFDEETAIRETVRDGTSPCKASIGQFVLLRKIRVLDLSNVPEIPSIFDQQKRHLKDVISFFADFVSSITRPVEHDGKQHIEYVPTQIITEYYRHVFHDIGGETIQGILFPSALYPYEERNAHVNCVLFIDNSGCCDNDNRSPKSLVDLTEVRHRDC